MNRRAFLSALASTCIAVAAAGRNTFQPELTELGVHLNWITEVVREAWIERYRNAYQELAESLPNEQH